MNALIVEDEALSAQHLKTLLHKTAPEINVVNILDTVQDTVDYLKTFPAIDIIFLDVHLADGISFDIFQQVEVKQPIIFTTAYDEFALKAFKVNSIDYLLKPIDKLELKEAFQKFKTIQKSTSNIDALKEMLSQISAPKNNFKERFLVKLGERLISVPTNDIAYFLSKDKLTYLITC